MLATPEEPSRVGTSGIPASSSSQGLMVGRFCIHRCTSLVLGTGSGLLALTHQTTGSDVLVHSHG